MAWDGIEKVLGLGSRWRCTPLHCMGGTGAVEVVALWTVWMVVGCATVHVSRVKCAWCAVHGAWCAWCAVPGAWCA